MMIIVEVGSPVAAAALVVEMVVIDKCIDGSVSSSRCDLQHQW
jgi:hypothetical protein